MGQDPDRPRPLAPNRRFLWKTSSVPLKWLVAVALFMENLDATVVNTAAPTMAASLGVEPLSLKGVLTSYTLALAVFIPDQRLGGGSLRHAPRVRNRDPAVLARLAFSVASRSTCPCWWRRACCRGSAAR